MTPPLTLRPIEGADVPMVQQSVSSEEVARTCNVPWPYPEDGAYNWVRKVVAARAEGRRHTFAILYDGEFAGVVDLEKVDRTAGTAELRLLAPGGLLESRYCDRSGAPGNRVCIR